MASDLVSGGDEQHRERHEPTSCLDCLMAWLLYGDGAICLAHRQPVVWIGRKERK